MLERFVIHGLDQQLDAQIGILAKAVRADGTLDQSRVVNLPAFDDPGSGWNWRVDGPNGRHWMRGTIDPLTLSEPPVRLQRLELGRARGPFDGGPLPGDRRGPSGEPVHFRQFAVHTLGGTVLVTAAGPRRVALRPLREAMIPLLGSLALLGVALALATLLQLRVGLRPLRTLRVALADVRAGRARHVPLTQPDELVPLASELNALIDQNEAGLEHARRHVSNLAHGLKTPLAALGVKLAESGRDPDGSLARMVAQIDSRVRHHLGRARAAAPGGAQRARTLLAPAIADLNHALERIHAERAVSVSTRIGPGLAVAVDPQDLDEMVGNLLDNAWRHARAAIGVEARQVDATIVLTIDDDGPGLAEAAISEALVPGRRLDERGDGHGFGLSIAEELAVLSGGKLALFASPLMGGLCVSLTLPANG
ncbi:sensor histidine kinase [uncultured Sphingomonas sp.]|uniref:sensor histidine kinase n=1 Tax=uncultured Sphingomonas sp. TaxID=158754 RepID=UPI0035CA7478